MSCKTCSSCQTQNSNDLEVNQEGYSKVSGFLGPFLRNCSDTCRATKCQISGVVPDWLSGSLIRNGPGQYQIGKCEYNHLFDGPALLQMYKIKDGQVTYQNTFLQSDSYRKNIKAQRIVVTALGTRSHRDPCLTLFQRLTNYFTIADIASDNGVVSFYEIADQLYAVTDGPLITKIDPSTLEARGKVDLRKYVPLTIAASHAHTDADGNTYNIGSHVGCYKIIMFPKDGGLESGKIISSIRARNPLQPSYCHSFLMTDNYFIFIEQPLVISIKSTFWRHFTFKDYSRMLKWKPHHKTRFHVVERASGRVLKQKYYSDAFAFFHTINAYEDKGNLVVDICCYDDGKVMEIYSLEAIELASKSIKEMDDQARLMNSSARRFILPIIAEQRASNGRSNGSRATARSMKGGAIYCQPEHLTDSGPSVAEMPQINYLSCNGKKYRYFYGITRRQTDRHLGLLKVDTVTKNCSYWYDDDCYPAEPVFVARPLATEEDDGVILSTVVSLRNENETFLLILDSSTFKEIGRASITLQSPIPASFHAKFLSLNKCRANIAVELQSKIR
ncbi:Beta,beta-carotene 9',10'-oxygenase [Halotydeus destructor]|nr:Beta,beta-carotene 9',10'-oxygenase [Halotydeus destructor]